MCSIESFDYRVERLAHDREHHFQSHINKTNEQCTQRLTSDRNQHTFTHSIESDGHRVKW